MKKEYDFSKPVRITEYKKGQNGLSILFYSFLQGLTVLIILLILFAHKGGFQFELTIPRVLLSIPFILLFLLFKQLLDEIRKYTPLLLKQPVWSLKELCELTQKSEEETEKIITRVLESAFEVQN